MTEDIELIGGVTYETVTSFPVKLTVWDCGIVYGFLKNETGWVPQRWDQKTGKPYFEDHDEVTKKLTEKYSLIQSLPRLNVTYTLFIDPKGMIGLTANKEKYEGKMFAFINLYGTVAQGKTYDIEIK